MRYSITTLYTRTYQEWYCILNCNMILISEIF